MSRLPSVAIDLPIILDSYKFLTILNGIDKKYSEIIIPESLCYLEIFLDSLDTYSHNFNLFNNDVDELLRFLQKMTNISNRINPNNIVAALSLFKLAYNKGIIKVVESKKYDKIGQELLGTQYAYSLDDICVVNTERKKVIVFADLPVAKAIFGMQTDDIVPIFGNVHFLDDLREIGYLIDNVKLDKHLLQKIELPEIYSIEELFSYALEKNYLNRIDFDLHKHIINYEKKKDITFLSLEFFSTLALDNVVFDGYPISSGAAFIYHLIKTIVSDNKKEL
jgi:hypothetical protein